MFVGHYALGLGAKRVLPRISLGTLFLACQLADLLWPTLVLAGVERFSIHPGDTVVTPLSFTSYPYSHSALMLLVWGALLGALGRFAWRWTWREAGIVAALVLSHWVLDVIVHRPDMPLAPGGGPLLGLGAWNSLPLTIVLEFGLFAAGGMIYLRTTRARDRTGAMGTWTLLAFLALVELANLFGPAPPNANAVTYLAEAMWLLVLWGFWVDRHREAVAPVH